MIASSENTVGLTGRKMLETRGKLTCKSDNITETLIRGMTAEITPNEKRTSKRVQDEAKKTRCMRKK